MHAPARRSGGMPSGKILNYKVESGGTCSPTIMIIAKNAHYGILCMLL